MTNPLRKLLTPEMQEYFAYQDYLQLRANRRGLPEHRPYCGCRSTWTEHVRDPSCVYPEDWLEYD